MNPLAQIAHSEPCSIRCIAFIRIIIASSHIIHTNLRVKDLIAGSDSHAEKYTPKSIIGTAYTSTTLSFFALSIASMLGSSRFATTCNLESIDCCAKTTENHELIIFFSCTAFVFLPEQGVRNYYET